MADLCAALVGIDDQSLCLRAAQAVGLAALILVVTVGLVLLVWGRRR